MHRTGISRLRSSGFVDLSFGQCSEGNAWNARTFVFGLVEQAGDLRQPGLELSDRVREAPACVDAVGGGEELADQGAERVVLVLAHVATEVAQEVDRAALPRRAEHPCDRGLQPGCASLMVSCTPTRPRATSDLRNSVQNASVSASPTSRPMISLRPVS